MKDGRFIMQGDGVCAFYEECTAADIIGVLGMVYRVSGRAVSVSSLRWRILSRLWRSLGVFQESRFVYFSSYSVLINMLLCLLLLLKVFT